MLRLFKNLPVQLILCVLIAFFIGKHLDTNIVSGIYTLSCLLKDYLMFILPLVIVGYIAAAILSLERGAPLLILTIVALVCVSNILAANVAYFASVIGLPFVTTGAVNLSVANETIHPYFSLPLPQLLSPLLSMAVGMTYGLLFSFIRLDGPRKLAFKVRDFATLLLQKTFIPFLPFYVFGFVVKMQKEGTLGVLFENCGQIMLLMGLLMLTYILFMYALACRFNFRETVACVKNMFPAFVTAFSTMSSAATMPITLGASEKNLGDAKFAQLIIPATVNIHLVGDTLGIILLSLATLHLAGVPLPDFNYFVWFSLYFCMAKFSVPGIPGGGVIVLLPVMKAYLGLTDEMGTLLTTLYILQDSLFTSSNVMGNGAFAILCQDFLRWVRLVKPPVEPQESQGVA